MSLASSTSVTLPDALFVQRYTGDCDGTGNSAWNGGGSLVKPAGEHHVRVERFPVRFPVQDGGSVDVSYQADSYCVDWLSVYGESALQCLSPADQVFS